MFEFADIADFYLSLINNLKKGSITLDSPLDMTVLRVSWNKLAYIDNRRDAKSYGYDFWRGIDTTLLPSKGIGQNQRYSESQKFPDFVFKVEEHGGQLTNGSLLETKDTRSGGISSFNSTIPTGTKSLEEVDVINNGEIVSKIASIKDGNLASKFDYRTMQRRCFYFIRTYRGSDKAKTSLIDGSFFETVPKDFLISQMFLNILERHRVQKKLSILETQFTHIKNLLAQITDQTIIAASQSIDKASIKPRLRIMAEVNPEGNPHSQHYPQIKERTINLIVSERLFTAELQNLLLSNLPELTQFTLQHKRNGKYIVFQFKTE